jgi:hypothetical protein
MQNPNGNMTAMDPAAMAERAREAQYQVSAKMWEASVKMNCGKYNFKLIQFIVDDDVELFGSDWQKLVCKQINIPEQYSERFWHERGKKVARMAINRRRQNTGIAMKKRFKGKYRRGLISMVCNWLNICFCKHHFCKHTQNCTRSTQKRCLLQRISWDSWQMYRRETTLMTGQPLKMLIDSSCYERLTLMQPCWRAS